MGDENLPEMEHKVEISRGVLAGLVLGLVACLVAIAFLLGRESARPVAATSQGPATQSATAVPPLAQLSSDSSEGRRTLALQAPLGKPPPVSAPSGKQSVRASGAPAVTTMRAARPPERPRPAQVAPPPPGSGGMRPSPKVARDPAARPSPNRAKAAVTPPPPDREPVRRYFTKIDQAMVGTRSMEDPNAFATELLQQSLAGDSSGFDALIASSEASLRKLEAIKPPQRCLEHHALMVGQLQQGLGLLRKVNGATTSMDASSLSSLSLQGQDLQSGASRLQELEKTLRSEIR